MYLVHSCLMHLFSHSLVGQNIGEMHEGAFGLFMCMLFYFILFYLNYTSRNWWDFEEERSDRFIETYDLVYDRSI